jgi:Apea-like HEPN
VNPEKHALGMLTAVMDHIHATMDQSDDLAGWIGRGGRLFFDAELGGLELSREDNVRYQEALEAIWRLVQRHGHISRSAIEGRVQRAILLATDPARTSKDEYSVRRDRAVAEVGLILHAPPVVWEVVFTVHGIGAGLPLTVAGIEFALVDEQTLARWQARVGAVVLASPAGQSTNEASLKFVAEHLKNDFGGRVVALVSVDAVDQGAAQQRASRKLRLTLDVLNFYADIFHNPGLHTRAFLPGEVGQVIEPILLMQAGQKSFALHSEVRGPIEPLSLANLVGEHAQKLGVPRILALLDRPRRNEIEEQLVAAFQWAGRATVEPRSELAFMLYVIALDTLLSGGKGESGAAAFRLRLRCAHLLGGTITQRQEILKNISELYAARSKLVHSGFATLTPAEQGLARNYAKGAIIRFLTEEPFASFTSRAQCDSWFDSQLLGSGADGAGSADTAGRTDSPDEDSGGTV